MGKRIIQQARGKGSLTYRVRKKAFNKRVGYPSGSGEAELLKLIHSAAHSAPIAKFKLEKEIFFNVAFEGAFEGQRIAIGEGNSDTGNIILLKDISPSTKIFNIERNPGDGGKMIRSAGSKAVLHKKLEHNKIEILMPNKKIVKLNGNCRASIGIIAGDGRKKKPMLKAGRMFHKMKSRGKLWPRTSAVCMNAIDHPFGSGRGKRIKSKTAKRNSPPGRKVGHLSPRRTGKKK
jgi:large subunit ribosomal protein L2